MTSHTAQVAEESLPVMKVHNMGKYARRFEGNSTAKYPIENEAMQCALKHITITSESAFSSRPQRDLCQRPLAHFCTRRAADVLV